ncbi:nuclear transport factor 2 family protein, partial [Haemophilus influenzae]|uniref:nuclear transport factor 2 family protein n=1 Tax=Haemophilus influenzae TaxID=727 RepID=UPI0013D41BD5
TTPEDSTRAVVARYFETMKPGAAPEVIAALFSEAVDWEIAGDIERVSWIGRKTGRAGVASFVRELFERIEPVRFEVGSILVEGKRAVALGALISRVKSTAKTIETEFAIDFTIED